jgi:glycosyltransferase involved in cell wall biosynthesis
MSSLVAKVVAVDRETAVEAPRSGGRIALFLPTLAGGGAERVMLTLAKGLRDRGFEVDVVVVTAQGPFVSDVPSNVRLIELRTRRVMYSVFRLAAYLKHERPAALLATLNTANAVAVMARWLSRQPTRIVIRQADHLTRGLESITGSTAIVERALVRWCYPHADAVVAVSQGVAEDLSKRPYMRGAIIRVVPNPIVTDELQRLIDAPLDDDWFLPGAPPVILGVGRLTRQKRFDVLIRAFAAVRERMDARLLILGEGEERELLEAQVGALGLGGTVRLPGFVGNPFPAMSRAGVFVLSSAFEGSPGALIQALACGTPVVATDCDSGPREILQGGRFGRLIPVDDAGAMAEAICATLRTQNGACATDAYLPYTERASVYAYTRVLQSPGMS